MLKLVPFTKNIEEEMSYLEMFKVQTKELPNNHKLTVFRALYSYKVIL